ncbi:MAG: hypothetical protein IJ131_08845 [Eggerthellaceae bacterium]|nr:hypothetical protein [Eggerthellaceae bacterium]
MRSGGSGNIDEYVYIRYTLLDRVSNQALSPDVPIKIQTKEGYAQDGAHIPIMQTIYDADGNELDSVTTDNLYYRSAQGDAKKCTSSGCTTVYGYKDRTQAGHASTWTSEVDYVRYAFQVKTNTYGNTGIGRRYYERVIIEDTLPEGAVFNQSQNPGWTYNEETGKLRYIYNPSSVITSSSWSSDIATLYLKYPCVEFGTQVENTATITLVPAKKAADEVQPTIDSTAYSQYQKRERPTTAPTRPAQNSNKSFAYSLDSEGNQLSGYYYDLQRYRERSYVFNLYFQGTRGSEYQDFKYYGVEFHETTEGNNKLDSRLYYEKVRLYKTADFKGTVAVWDLSSGQEVAVPGASGINLENMATDYIDVALGPNVTEFKVKADEGDYYYVPESTNYNSYHNSLQVSVFTKFRNPNSKALTGTSSASLYNYATISANVKDFAPNEPNNYSYVRSGYFTLYPPRIYVYTSKSHIGYQTTADPSGEYTAYTNSYVDTEAQRQRTFLFRLQYTGYKEGHKDARLYSMSLIDEDLDPSLKYTFLRIPKNERYNGTVRIKATTRDNGSEIVLATGIEPSEIDGYYVYDFRDQTAVDPANSKKLAIEAEGANDYL